MPVCVVIDVVGLECVCLQCRVNRTFRALQRSSCVHLSTALGIHNFVQVMYSIGRRMEEGQGKGGDRLGRADKGGVH